MDTTSLHITEPTWDDHHEQLVNNPFSYLKEQTEGKNLRKLLIETFNQLYQIPPEKLEKLSEIINYLHLSSLIIDDIEDDSKLRRGKPCSHLIFGVPQAINSSNYTYFKTMQLLNDFFCEDPKKNFKAQQIFMDEMINLHRGQGLDLYWRDNGQCPDESEYISMVMNKTGGLFRLSIKLLNLLAGHEEYTKLVELSNLLGIVYQIKDDYLNLKSPVYNSNKGFCEDITEASLTQHKPSRS
ncbi:unnamed protein product [Ambrosiozyma monospora]|uniref:Unnamed protein product n=1 Tax=Ambrosiozyma monospora TaxID=43982 RepID=A0A9W6T4R3_AMBMO|nr:unnamed protein product [Ambrosiozyma monospora]